MFRITKAQILHLLSGIVFAPMAGVITAWLAQHFPGLPHFSSAQLTAVFISASGVVLGLAIHYLHGWQVWERTIGRIVDVEDAAKRPTAHAGSVPPSSTPPVAPGGAPPPTP